ncbi:hypothetical protein PoB_002650900 [Plakobranchus ocellatus]|uniref:Uncharacterized protein n=1 Tax=Plakobranchus ocellatus TaxID=259542 RepID=A0AAV3ZXG3_9GAST|nr:hypothetical protein PoB_002650900 [Plakobranchus ocellatus]
MDLMSMDLESFQALQIEIFAPQQGGLRLSGPPSGQGAGGGARTRDRRVSADLRADSLATVPPTPHTTRMAATQAQDNKGKHSFLTPEWSTADKNQPNSRKKGEP